MRFEIPAHLTPRLRALQADRRNNVAAVLGSEDAVRLLCDSGRDTYLTLDGRFVLCEWMDEEPPCEASDPKEAYSAVMLGAKMWDAP